MQGCLDRDHPRSTCRKCRSTQVLSHVHVAPGVQVPVRERPESPEPNAQPAPVAQLAAFALVCPGASSSIPFLPSMFPFRFFRSLYGFHSSHYADTAHQHRIAHHDTHSLIHPYTKGTHWDFLGRLVTPHTVLSATYNSSTAQRTPPPSFSLHTLSRWPKVR